MADQFQEQNPGQYPQAAAEQTPPAPLVNNAAIKQQADVNALTPDLQQFANTSYAEIPAPVPSPSPTPDMNAALGTQPPSIAENPQPLAFDTSQALQNLAVEPGVTGIPQIPTTESPTAVQQPEAVPQTAQSSMPEAVPNTTPTPQVTETPNIPVSPDANILSLDPNAIQKIVNSTQGSHSTPDVTPINPYLSPSNTATTAQSSGIPEVIDYNPDKVSPRQKAPEYVDMPNEEPLALGEQHAVAQIQQSGIADTPPNLNNAPQQAAEAQSTQPAAEAVQTTPQEIVQPTGITMFDELGRPILQNTAIPTQTVTEVQAKIPQNAQTKAETAMTSAQPQSQTPDSAYSIPENSTPVGFEYPDQKVNPSEEVSKLTSEKTQESNLNKELKLPEGIMETLKQVESDTHTAFKLTEKLVQNLSTGEQEFIKKLQGAILSNTPIRDFLQEEELPKTA